MAYELEIGRIGRVSSVIFARSGKANALTIAMQHRLTAHLAQIAAEEACAGVVINGGEASVFSAGADFRETDDAIPPEEFADLRSRAMFELLTAVLTCPKPVVAAVNGHAVGSGCLLALVADGRVASPGATFSLPEIERGQPTFAGAAIVRRRLNEAIAGDLVQSGRRLGLEEAERQGLIAATVERDRLVAAGAELVEKLSQSPDAFALNKAWINDGFVELLAQARLQSAEVRRARSRK